MLLPHGEILRSLSRSATRSPHLSGPLTSSSSGYCPDYANIYNQPAPDMSSSSFPPRGESETDTFKEYVSGLYLYVQSLDPLSKPFLSTGVAILGYHGKLTCTRDWSVRGVETKVSSGGSSYMVDLSAKYDMLYMIVFARFLEHCDQAMRKGREAGIHPQLGKDEGHMVEEVMDDSLENPTDTYKEVYFPSYRDQYKLNTDSKLT